MRGLPTYTVLSVAFPTSIREPHIVDEINVSFNAKGGGTHGEFGFRWYMFNSTSRPTLAMEVHAFTDGMAAMLDNRIVPILEALARRKDSLPEVSVDWMVGKLEEAGVKPSTYQLRGLYASTYGSVDFWPKSAQAIFRQLTRHEGING